MKFYINNHPIITIFNHNEKEHESLPVGTAFTICGIANSFYSLKPVKKTGSINKYTNLEFTPEMLESAFTAVDYLPE